MKLYISGPISHPNPAVQSTNLSMFDAAADQLRAAGFEVFNPASHGPALTYGEYMRADLKALLDCDGVATLPRWQASRGAALEVQVANICGIRVAPLRAWILAAANHHGMTDFTAAALP